MERARDEGEILIGQFGTHGHSWSLMVIHGQNEEKLTESKPNRL